MKKIYQIVFTIFVLFLFTGQENIVFGQVDLQTALSGKLACGQVMVRSTTDSTNQIVKDTIKTTRVVMRCYSSYTPTKEPLYVINGVPQENDSIFNKINPNDIESISVLKGAEATAIWGFRGGYSVIIMTTKKKEVKETKVEKILAEEISINVFPNPTSESVNITLNLKEKSVVEIIMYNLQTLESYEVSKEVYEAGEQQINWKVDSLQNGTYNIKIKIGNQIIDRKVVIQK